MEKAKAIAIPFTQIDALIVTALGVVAIIAPAIGQQFLTGTLVNATLFIATFRYGWKIAALLGILPSSISLVIGFLVPAVAPLIPFIMLSNVLLVWLFARMEKQDYWIRAISAVALKTAFLFAIGFAVSQFIGDAVLIKIASNMFTWMQAVTGITGAALAFGFYKIYKKT